MKSNELRIGNLINYCPDSISCNFTPKVIDNEFMILLLDGRCQLDTDCEPIPLTKEWLVRFGFDDMINGVYIDNKHQVVIYKDILGYYFEPYQGKKTIIEYIHQLQNLYFALTNEELKWKS